MKSDFYEDFLHFDFLFWFPLLNSLIPGTFLLQDKSNTLVLSCLDVEKSCDDVSDNDDNDNEDDDDDDDDVAHCCAIFLCYLGSEI